MIRNFIAIFRSLVVGPQLSRLSKLHVHQVEQIVAGTNNSFFASTQETNVAVVNAASSQEIQTLRLEHAQLAERIEVLERMVERRLKE